MQKPNRSTPPSGIIHPVNIHRNTAYIEGASLSTGPRPEVKLGLVANLFVRMMHFQNIDDCELGHTHSFNHLTLLASGALMVTANGEDTIFKAPSMIYIDADTVHELTALEPNTVAYCIHALRDLDVSEDILSEDMVPNGIDLGKILSQLKT